MNPEIADKEDAMPLRARTFRFALTLGLLAIFGGCSLTSDGDGSGDRTGTVSLGLAMPPTDVDVTAVLFEVTSEAGETQSQIVPLHPEPLPETVDPSLAGHRFADWFVVLNSGVYNIVATPLASVDPAAPSEMCEAVTDNATAFAGATTEILLVSNCVGDNGGGLDVVVVLNRPPFIEELEFDPSKFVCNDEAAAITASASDPDGDEVAYDWLVTVVPDGVEDSDYCLASSGGSAAFSAVVPGRYELTLSVSDGRAVGRLVFPVYILDCGEAECPGDAALSELSTPPDVTQGRCMCDDDQNERVLICHVPPGNPDNAHTISVGASAVDAHLRHGDHLGPCEEDGAVTPQ